MKIPEYIANVVAEAEGRHPGLSCTIEVCTGMELTIRLEAGGYDGRVQLLSTAIGFPPYTIGRVIDDGYRELCRRHPSILEEINESPIATV